MDFSAAQRKVAARKGQALPDGSFPIRNRADLANAIRAVGRADASDRAKVRRHIVKRARALNALSAIPASWNADGSMTAGS